MSKVELFNCYDFNEEWYLVEMKLDISASEIDWMNIVVPDKKLDKSNWQCAYMEQYLNDDGTERICNLYDIPSGDIKPCRVAFFIFKNKRSILFGNRSKVLSTPYGEFKLCGGKLPSRLKGVVEFEQD